MVTRKHIFATLVFALLSTILIFSWFRYGLLYGGGDVGIPSYDPSRIVDIAKYVWWDSAAPGALVPHGVASLPVQFFQSTLAGLGLPFFAVQAILFWMLLFLTGYGMFLVGLSIFGKDKVLLAILCGLFYMFNPYMMIQVWHRFIHNSFFLAAFLPFFYLFWDDWIKKGKFISILLFLLANIFGVYLYGSIAYVVTVVFILSFIFFKHIFIPWQGLNNFKKLAFRFITGLILWFLIHTWWMLPTFSISPALFSTQHRTYESLATLLTLSRQTLVPYTLSGINPFYLFEQADFGEVYKHPVFLTIMWLPLLLIIPGFLVAIRSKILSFWGILLIMAGFLAKGAASPFGFIYIFGFSAFFPLGVLRNPFEKLGILLPFSLAIIYTAGVRWYLEKFDRRGAIFLKGGLIVLLILQLGVFLWPFWLGKLIGKSDKLAFVDVPWYYRQADAFIGQQRKTGKILHLPLPEGESISYRWPYPFSGIESSQLLFKSLPSISRGQNIKHIDDIISAVSNIFREDVEDEKIINILEHLNVRFIVLHKDVVWQGGFLDDPQKLEVALDKKNFLKKKGVFTDLVVYEIAEVYFKPRIYTTSLVNFLSGGEKNSFWPYLLSQNNVDLISTINLSDQSIINPLQTVIIPTTVWTFHPEDIPLEKAIAELPAASKILPGSEVYFLIRLKEDIRILTSLGPEKLKLKLNFLGKRLVEVIRLKESGKKTIDVVNTYRKSLSEVFYTDNLKDQLDFIGGREFVKGIFAKHLTILDTLLEKADSSENEVIRQAKDELVMALRASELIPMYDVKVDKSIEDLEYTTYHFQVPLQGEYELLMADVKARDVYSDRLEKLEFQINGEKKELRGEVINGFMSYGKIKLDAGRKEFILAVTPSANLFDSSRDEIEVSSTNQDNSFFETRIEPLTSDTWYTVKFESWIKAGDKFKLQLISDGNVEYDKFFTKDINIDDWNKYREGILFNKLAATHASIRFLVESEDGKEGVTVVFKNIVIERLLNNPVFLRSTGKVQTPADAASSVRFTQQSPVYYSGNIKLDSGGFIIFSESFHKDWQLRLFNDKESFVPERRFLANMYANAWFVPQGGEYQFELEFTPQRTLYTGLIISTTVFLSMIIFYLMKKKKWLRK